MVRKKRWNFSQFPSPLLKRHFSLLRIDPKEKKVAGSEEATWFEKENNNNKKNNKNK